MAQTINDFKAVLAKHGVDTATPDDPSWGCKVCKAGLEFVLKEILTVALGAADPASALTGLVGQIAGATGLANDIISGILSAIGVDGKEIQDIIDEIIAALCKAIGACS